MFNYEWQKCIKQKYLNMAHAMQTPYRGDRQVILDDIKAANEMIEACQKYIAEQENWLERDENGEEGDNR